MSETIGWDHKRVNVVLLKAEITIVREMKISRVGHEEAKCHVVVKQVMWLGLETNFWEAREALAIKYITIT